MTGDMSDPQVYAELKRIAARLLRRERARDSMFDTTVLVHEAWLRLRQTPEWACRAHFYGAASLAIRRILVERARRRLRRRGDRPTQRLGSRADALPGRSPSDPADLIALDEALTQLERTHPRAAEVVAFHKFLGLPLPEVAQITGQGLRTVERDWHYARAWLLQRMSDPRDAP